MKLILLFYLILKKKIMLKLVLAILKIFWYIYKMLQMNNFGKLGD